MALNNSAFRIFFENVVTLHPKLPVTRLIFLR